MLDENGKPVAVRRSVDPGRDPGPDRRAGSPAKRSWCSADERKAREIALFRQGKFRDVKLAQAAGREAREHVRPGRRQVQTLPLIVKADVQGSQEALVHALNKLSTDEVRVVHRPCGGRRHHRVRHQPRDRVEGGRHRLQHACRCAGAQARRGQRRRHPLLQHHLRRGRRGEGGDGRHARAGEARRADRHGRGPRRSSRSRRSARWPVAWSPKASCVAARWCACCATTSSRGPASSIRSSASRTTSREVRAGFECGLSLKNFSDIQEGDQLEIFEVQEVARTL